MDKNDILDYVTETPGNTNRAVLSGMLDSIAGGGGGGGASDIFVIRFDDPETPDKTFSELETAFNEGKIPVAIYGDKTLWLWDTATKEFSFQTTIANGNGEGGISGLYSLEIIWWYDELEGKDVIDFFDSSISF